MHYGEEGKDSELQLVFCPGGFNPEIWRHQLKYFSKKCKTVGFGTTRSENSYSGEKEALRSILDQEHIDNAVLVSNLLGNPLIQSFEDRQDVKTTVLSGPLSRGLKLEKSFYNLTWRIAKRKPKIMKKIFFSPECDYSSLKSFAEKVDPPSHESFLEYAEKDVRRPVKISLVIHAEDDRFSSMENARNLNSRLSVIRRAGSFCFYEKPQEFNKALSDYLEIVRQEIRKQEIFKSSEKNRSLEEFGREVKTGK